MSEIEQKDQRVRLDTPKHSDNKITKHRLKILKIIKNERWRENIRNTKMLAKEQEHIQWVQLQFYK